ncbi:right-handed parallel beta-helix repeat-containing protein [Halomicrobium zhouii]|uniref:right-handed parallel beta-helix repeat-containing protein n=1 Tax=Halomicrobium zhouii TaxID=767519 RepID=UPI001160765A|nr:right-handed parallel beta-helix repeat-containing protein [Halomicrobium zhouii]
MALVLAVITVVAVGAGGGLAVADLGGPTVDAGAHDVQSENVTEGTDGDESASDADDDTEPSTETEPAETATSEPDDAGASGGGDAADEATATPSETPTATDTPTEATTETETPESTNPATADDATDAETGNASRQANETDGVNDTETPNESAADGELSACTVIDEPGQYELTGDVSGSGTCLVVEASGVVLDGNGHTVAGPGSGTGVQVAGGVSDVTVRDVDVSDWSVAVALGGSGASGPTANLVEVRATDSDTGVRLTEADGSAMQAVTASDNGDGVVLVDTADVQASDVTVDGNDGTGLWLARGVSESSFSIVQATDNGDRGIHVATGAVDNFVGDATVTDNGGPGVEFADSSDNVLADSRVERNGGPGVLSYPAGGDRLENVQIGDNGDGAYRDQAERAGAVADAVTLGDGASVQFDQGVTRLASVGTPDSLPEGTESAGPGVDVALRDGDGATATVTVPVDADGEVTAYQRVDGTWQEVDGVTVSDGEAEISVSQSGTVVPVVESAGDESAETTADDGTESAPGDDTVRADASSNEEAAASDATSAGDEATAGANTGSESDEPVPARRYAFDDDRFADVGASAAAQSENRTRTLVIGPAAVEEPIEYTFAVDGNVSKVTTGGVTADENDAISRTDGTVTVTGTTSAGDAYHVDGDLRSIRQTGGSTGFFVRFDTPIDANETQP